VKTTGLSEGALFASGNDFIPASHDMISLRNAERHNAMELRRLDDDYNRKAQIALNENLKNQTRSNQEHESAMTTLRHKAGLEFQTEFFSQTNGINK
jgi:hypothetical protein